METPKAQHAAAAYVADLGITYTPTFVPFSRSRNAKPNPKFDDLQINWLIRLDRGGRMFMCDYQEGIGHLPKGTFHRGLQTSIANYEVAQRAVEEGKAGPFGTYAKKTLTPPAIESVLHSLVLDYDVLNYARYEEWAAESGYDTDSRKGEAIYKACIEQALQLRAVLHDGEIQKLQELLQDY